MKPGYNNMSIDDMHHGAFAGLWNSFYNDHYELSVDEDCNLTAVATEDAEYMPKIEIATIYENGKYYYSPKLTFPVLDNEDMEFYDDIAHWTNKWKDIGRLMTELIEFVYNPDAWVDDEDYEDEEYE